MTCFGKKYHRLQLTPFKFISFLYSIFSETHLSDKYMKEVQLKSLEKRMCAIKPQYARYLPGYSTHRKADRCPD